MICAISSSNRTVTLWVFVEPVESVRTAARCQETRTPSRFIGYDTGGTPAAPGRNARTIYPYFFYSYHLLMCAATRKLLPFFWKSVFGRGIWLGEKPHRRKFRPFRSTPMSTHRTPTPVRITHDSAYTSYASGHKNSCPGPYTSCPCAYKTHALAHAISSAYLNVALAHAALAPAHITHGSAHTTYASAHTPYATAHTLSVLSHPLCAVMNTVYSVNNAFAGGDCAKTGGDGKDGEGEGPRGDTVDQRPGAKAAEARPEREEHEPHFDVA